MDYNGGPYDRDPYGRHSDGRDDGSAEESFGRGEFRERGGYGQSPYSDSRYGQSPYGEQPYGGYEGGRDSYGNTGRTQMPREDYGNTGRTQMPRDEYGNTGRTQMPRDGYGNTGRTQMPRDEYGNTGRTQMPREDYGNTGRTQMPRDEYGNTGRTQMPRDGYSDNPYGAYAAPRGDYGRDNPYGGGYGSQDDYDRGDEPRDGRAQMRQSAYDRQEPRASEAYDDMDDEMPEERTPRKRKKKRSKFSRFMRGLAAYIAQLPTKTLIIFGGSIAVVLVGVILLVMLLPKNEKTTEIPDSGQLSIADITPTPSLAPTLEIVETPVADVTPTPIVDPFNGSFIKTVGEKNDVIPAVQERLVALGYMEKPADGFTTTYGKATKNAIRIFQVKNYDDSQDWDGILGAGTYTLLMSNEAKAFYLSRGDGDSRTKDLTQLVEAVKKLQAKLIELGYLSSGSDTGVFGSGTADAVKTFQQYHGLLADGWAGASTLEMLYSDKAMTATAGKANPYTPTPAPGATDAAATTPDPNATAATGGEASPDAASAPTNTAAGTVVN